MEQRIEEVGELLGLDLSPGSVERLRQLVDLLATTGVEAGVIAPGDAEVALERHVLDCLRAAPYAQDSSEILDLGSGGGLPALPLAIVFPDVIVRPVDRRRRKIGFIELAADRLGLENIRPELGDIAALSTEPVEVATARALASPEDSWELARGHLALGGRLIYFAGQGFRGVEDLPELVSCETVPGQLLATSGPLAIMTRK